MSKSVNQKVAQVSPPVSTTVKQTYASMVAGHSPAKLGETAKKVVAPPTLSPEEKKQAKYKLAKGMLSGGRLKEGDLQKLVPSGTSNTFVPSKNIAAGYKYMTDGVEVKWHSADKNAARKFPGSNSGKGWTAQIRVGWKLMDSKGNLVSKPSNETHIPVDK